jgi:hypothetical protein
MEVQSFLSCSWARSLEGKWRRDVEGFEGKYYMQNQDRIRIVADILLQVIKLRSGSEIPADWDVL